MFRHKRSWNTKRTWCSQKYSEIDYNRNWNKIIEHKEWFYVRFNVYNFVSARIVSFHTTMALFILLTSKKVIPCVLFCLELLYLHDFQARKYYLNYCSPITVFPCYLIFLMGCLMFRISDVWDVGRWECEMFGMRDVWDVWCSRYAMLKMWDVWDGGCSRCGMFGMGDVPDVGCFGCGMFGMWNVWDLGCLGWGLFGMWDVRDVGWSGCRMFRMWDVWVVGCSRCKMFRMWNVGCWS